MKKKKGQGEVDKRTRGQEKKRRRDILVHQSNAVKIANEEITRKNKEGEPNPNISPKPNIPNIPPKPQERETNKKSSGITLTPQIKIDTAVTSGSNTLYSIVPLSISLSILSTTSPKSFNSVQNSFAASPTALAAGL